MQSRIATLMVLAPPMALGSLATIESVVPPSSLLPREDRLLLEQNGVTFYDLYRSPCRGIIKASNDELMDRNDIDTLNDDEERNYIISYTSGGGGSKESDLYKSFSYYFDDMEYCGLTFFGGCRFGDLIDLKEMIAQADNTESFVNFTVVYDYEIHYSDNERSNLVSNDSEDPTTARLSNKIQKTPIRSKPSDPIPALEHVETIVADHLGEMVGLSRRQCDPKGRTSLGRKPRNTYRHGFSDEELGRMLAISTEPRDVLDPDHVDCTVPVTSAIGSTSDCVPVKGGISIYLNTTGLGGNKSLEDLELSIQSGFQRLIRFGMQQDLYVSEGGDEEVLVKYVSFIGTRIDVEDDSVDNGESGIAEIEDKSSDDGKESSLNILDGGIAGIEDASSDDGKESTLNMLDGGIAGIEVVVESSASKAGFVTATIGIFVALLVFN